MKKAVEELHLKIDNETSNNEPCIKFNTENLLSDSISDNSSVSFGVRGDTFLTKTKNDSDHLSENVIE